MATTGTWDYDKEGFAPVSPQAAAKADPYEAAGFTRPGQVDVKEGLKAAGEGFLGGAVETIGVVPAMIGGATAGAAVGNVPGAVIGGLGGGAYAMWAGAKAREGLGLRTPEQMRPEVRPWAVGGESLGGAVGAAGFPYAAAATGFRVLGESVAGKLLNRMIDSAKAMPVRFGLTEGAMATSAATAAATAESLFPGNVGARMSGEMIGGAVNPARVVRSAAERGVGLVRSGLESMSPDGRTTASAKLLADVASKTGENVDDLYRAYKATGVIGLENLTPAQKTGSMALGALEDHLAEFSGKFDMESKERARQGLDVLRGHIALLTRTGDPEALKAAAQARDIYYRTLIQARVDSGMSEAAQAVSKITKDTPEARAMLSTKVREVLDKSIVDARKAETELWQKWIAAEGNGPSKFDNLVRQFADEYENVLPEYRPKRVPSEVDAFIKRVGKSGEPTFVYDPATLSLKDVAGKAPGATVGEMYQLRSELLNEARQLSIAGDHSGARSMSNMAEAVLDDLTSSVTDAGRKMYDDARGFTKEFHDAFTRSFVGRMEAVGKYGDRIAPELTLRRALASGAEAGAVQLGEIEHATRFLTTRKLQDAGAVETVMDAQQRFIRLAASEAINIETGKVNPDRLRKFMQNNEILMNRFPSVKEDLTKAIKTTREMERLERVAKGQVRLIEDAKVFSKIIKTDGVVAAQSALVSDNVERDLGKLITMVKRGTAGPDGLPITASKAVDGKKPTLKIDPAAATTGLRAAVYTAAINASTGRNRGELNLDQVKGLLLTPPPGQRSAMQIMQDEGIVSPREAGQVKQLFAAMESIQRSQRVGTAVEVKPDVTDAAMAIFSRILGSGISSTVTQASPIGSGHGLIVAGAGARFGEYIFTKMGATTARNILIDAISDPSSGKLDIIMQQASRMTPKQITHQAMQMNAWAVQVGAEAIGQATDPFTGSW